VSGICGIIFSDSKRQVKLSELSPMLAALNLSAEAEDDALNLSCLAMGAQNFPQRLSGIAQLTSHEQSFALAFHGNLYDLKNIEREDSVLGALLQLYTREGIEFLQRIRGEFALALWDGNKQAIYLATDRFRVHPLFYYKDDEKLVFASRMKAVLACPIPIRRTINAESIVDVVASSVIPTPKTIFREVNKLPAGHVLTYSRGETRVSPYWEISFLHANGAHAPELTSKLRACFTDALSVRLEVDRASGRVGTFLSGGIDSTTVTGMLTRLLEHPVKSFSIGFEEQRFNEISYARIAAKAFNAEHYERFVSPPDVCDAIPVLLDAFDEPFANASAIPTYFCSRLAREQGVDVLYAGDGGDELFAGNERYRMQRLFDYYYNIPVVLRELLVKPLTFAFADIFKESPFSRGKNYIRRASIPYPDRLTSYEFFNIIPSAHFFSDDFLQTAGHYDPYGAVRSYYYQAPAREELDRQLYIDLKLAITDNDLPKVSRMAEKAGVSVRFPFLDHHFAEFAAAVPAQAKMPGLALRSFFKKAYSDLLPPKIRAKKKHGFGLPIPVWLKTHSQLNEMMHELLLSSRSVQRGYFRKKALEQLIERHVYDSTSFYGTILWNLMVLELWQRSVLDSAQRT
jgi:asparagine synthase (glutamine-hydrolysing)